MSANDVAVMLAEAAGGSMARFARAMDAESELLGLRASSWRNPHGLDAPGHRSTAFDLAILARAVLQDRWLARVVRKRHAAFTTPSGRRHSLTARPVPARLPGRRRGQDRLHRRRRHCLAAAATGGGRTLIAVVLHSPDNAADAGRMLDWGFGRGRSARTGLRPPPVSRRPAWALLTRPPRTVERHHPTDPGAGRGRPGQGRRRRRPAERVANPLVVETASVWPPAPAPSRPSWPRSSWPSTGSASGLDCALVIEHMFEQWVSERTEEEPADADEDDDRPGRRGHRWGAAARDRPGQGHPEELRDAAVYWSVAIDPDMECADLQTIAWLLRDASAHRRVPTASRDRARYWAAYLEGRWPADGDRPASVRGRGMGKPPPLAGDAQYAARSTGPPTPGPWSRIQRRAAGAAPLPDLPASGGGEGLCRVRVAVAGSEASVMARTTTTRWRRPR